MPPTWRQINIAFPDPSSAEDTAIAYLAPILAEAESRRLITAWFFVRKGHWRLRYRPASRRSGADEHLTGRLSRLTRAGHLTTVAPGTYEPEAHAFGGIMAMAVAHRLWHHDSRHLLTPADSTHAPRRRELSIILCAVMMRAVGLDWYEQGDVWARAAEHRDAPDLVLVDRLQNPVQRMLTVDPTSLVHAGASLAAARTWISAYTSAGATLDHLNQTGQLHRGLREVLTHHVIFMWNRRGIPGPHQAALATAAKTTIFGPDPTALRVAPGGRA